jgi:hypothetical protein
VKVLYFNIYHLRQNGQIFREEYSFAATLSPAPLPAPSVPLSLKKKVKSKNFNTVLAVSFLEI